MADKPEEAFSAREQFEDEYYTLVARARQLLSNSGAASERFLECGGGVAGSTDSIPGSLVRVVSHDGQQLHARILLDNGSTANFITQDLCCRLGLSRHGTSSTVTVKAVHLELVTDLTKEGYIAAKTKWHSSTASLTEGALVLIRDKTQPPLLWLLGRIVRSFPGADGITRVAEIKTKKGIIRRAYNNICPLPIY
ncbi:unnamed protein product, partial [Iphiclides podalirius]